MYKVIVPPYTTEDMFTMRYPPPDYVDEGFTGKGSAFKSIQVIGGIPDHDIENIDLGFVKLNIKFEGNKPIISYAHDEESNTGERSQTVGMGRGQIPVEEWLDAKAEGVPYAEFVQTYTGARVGEQTKEEPTSPTAESAPSDEDEAKYEILYAKLVQIAAEHGYRVVDVPYEKLLDYAAAHPLFAKTVNYDMPDDEIHMNARWNANIVERYQNLRHELEEMGFMEAGELYWPSHVKAHAREGDTDLEDIEMPRRIEKPEPQEVIIRVKTEQETEPELPAEESESMPAVNPPVQLPVAVTARKKRRKSQRPWWDDRYYPEERTELIGAQTYYGHRLLPPNVGGEL